MNTGDFDLYGIPQDVIESLLAYIGNDFTIEQREAFERRLLEDESFSEHTECARVLLLECYADGSLPSSLIERVERWIATSPSLHWDFVISRSLQHIAQRRKSVIRSRTWWGVLLPLAACILIALAFPVLRRERRASTVTTAVNQPVMPPVVTQPRETFLLLAQRRRGGQPASIAYHLPSGSSIRLQIVLPFNHRATAYTVIVKRESSRTPMAQSRATPVSGSAQTPFVQMDLPVNALPAGKYIVDVSAPAEYFSARLQILP